MPRSGRLVLPGYPHHIVQRGHNKQVVFAEDADYQYYLNALAELKEEFTSFPRSSVGMHTEHESWPECRDQDQHLPLYQIRSHRRGGG